MSNRRSGSVLGLDGLQGPKRVWVGVSATRPRLAAEDAGAPGHLGTAGGPHPRWTRSRSSVPQRVVRQSRPSRSRYARCELAPRHHRHAPQNADPLPGRSPLQGQCLRNPQSSRCPVLPGMQPGAVETAATERARPRDHRRAHRGRPVVSPACWTCAIPIRKPKCSWAASEQWSSWGANPRIVVAKSWWRLGWGHPALRSAWRSKP